MPERAGYCTDVLQGSLIYPEIEQSRPGFRLALPRAWLDEKRTRTCVLLCLGVQAMRDRQTTLFWIFFSC